MNMKIVARLKTVIHCLKRLCEMLRAIDKTYQALWCHYCLSETTLNSRRASNSRQPYWKISSDQRKHIARLLITKQFAQETLSTQYRQVLKYMQAWLLLSSGGVHVQAWHLKFKYLKPWTAHTKYRTNFIESYCYIVIFVTSLWARWRLKSPASWLFTQPFIQAQIKENIMQVLCLCSGIWASMSYIYTETSQ